MASDGEATDLPAELGVGTGLRVGWTRARFTVPATGGQLGMLRLSNGSSQPTTIPRKYLRFRPFDMAVRADYEGLVTLPPVRRPMARDKSGEEPVTLASGEGLEIEIYLAYALSSRLPGRYLLEFGFRNKEDGGKGAGVWWMPGAAEVIVDRASDIEIQEVLSRFSATTPWRMLDSRRIEDLGDMVEPRLLPLFEGQLAQLEDEMTRDKEGPIIRLEEWRLAIEKVRVWEHMDAGRWDEVEKYLAGPENPLVSRRGFKSMVEARREVLNPR